MDTQRPSEPASSEEREPGHRLRTFRVTSLDPDNPFGLQFSLHEQPGAVNSHEPDESGATRTGRIPDEADE